MLHLATCLRILGGTVLLGLVAVSSVVVGSVQAARVSGSSGGATSLDQAFDGGKTIDGANSEANARVEGDGTRYMKYWCDATLGCVAKPSPLADTFWRIWTNMNGYIWDDESNSAFATIDPDALGAGSGTLTFETGRQVVASNLGIEFSESDTNPTCAAGNYTVYADTSESKLKKCQNGTVSDLSATSSVTTGSVWKASDESVTSSTTMQDDNELFFAMDANSKYSFHGVISYEGGQTGDFKFQFTVPSGATGRRHSLHAQSTATSCSSAGQNTWGGPITTAVTGIGATGAQCEAIVDGFVSTAGTAGTLQLQFAQDTSDVTATTIKAGSFLEWRKH